MRLKKEIPISVVDLMKRAELAVRSCAEGALAPFGLTPTQFLLLFRLKQSKGLSSADLARAVGVRPQSIVDLIGPLERDGLITRREAPEHRRILRIALSATGEKLMARAIPVARRLEDELLASLSAPEIEHLHEGLTKLLDSAQAHETHPRMKRAAQPAAIAVARR